MSYIKAELVKDLVIRSKLGEAAINTCNKVITASLSQLQKKPKKESSSFVKSVISGKKFSFPLDTRTLMEYDALVKYVMKNIFGVNEMKGVDLYYCDDVDIALLFLSLKYIPVYLCTSNSIIMNDVAFYAYSNPDTVVLNQTIAPCGTEAFYADYKIFLVHRFNAAAYSLDILNNSSNFAIYKNILIAENPIINPKVDLEDLNSKIKNLYNNSDEYTELKDSHYITLEAFLNSPYRGVLRFDMLLRKLIDSILIEYTKDNIELGGLLSLHEMRKKYTESQKKGYVSAISQFIAVNPRLFISVIK